MINNVVLTGRLTKDVDLKYTQSGTAVGTFTLAVDPQFKNAQGEKETDFVNVVIWKKSSEALANYTRKGSLIGITGRIQTRNYENQQGQRVFVTEVVAEGFTFLESKNSQNGQQSPSKRQDNFKDYKQENKDPFLSSGQSIDIDESMLPF